MNSNLLKKLLAAAITGLFLVSVGVSAAEPVCKPVCKPDQKCVTTSTQPRPHCVPR